MLEVLPPGSIHRAEFEKMSFEDFADLYDLAVKVAEQKAEAIENAKGG